jgi:hypothetical protein
MPVSDLSLACRGEAAWDFCLRSLCLRPDLMGTIRVTTLSAASGYVNLPDIDRNEDR